MAALDRRGYKTNIFLARLLIYRDLRVYRTKTREESGRTAPLYGLWFPTLFAMAAFGLMTVPVR